MSKLYIVGIGPGEKSGMTLEAEAALSRSDVIVGYSKYIELVKPYYTEKEYLDSYMTKEVDRCKSALKLSDDGKTVALVCSGDSGVYGMAGLIYELCSAYPNVEIEIVPGVTAALSGGAILGAPIGHDFAVVSLSDRLTPWELIEKRLTFAAQGDFCICLYNPASCNRRDYLKKACDILLKTLSSNTICGIAKNIGREGEAVLILNLIELRETEVDMFTTVFIGNSSTKNIGGRMVTPRGYRNV
ncbi:MAG: precorrin-3B C(17)-methyltransferase [Clostridia bacterium]